MNTIPDFPAALTRTERDLVSRDGLCLTIRRVTPDDAAALNIFLLGLSSQSLRLRYLAPRHFSPDTARREAERICRGDQGAQIALVAITPSPTGGEVIAVVEVVPDAREPTLGHVAAIVRDDYQARGIGTLLVRRLLELARVGDLTMLRADFLIENHAIRRLLDRLGLPYAIQFHRGEIEVRIEMRAVSAVPMDTAAVQYAPQPPTRR